MGEFELSLYENASELARGAAERFVEWVSARLAETPGALPAALPVALSGGRIAGAFFREVTLAAKERKLSFDCLEFFFADERWVPLTEPESNFHLAQTHLFEPMRVPPANLHPIYGATTPEDAAQRAEASLRLLLPSKPSRVPSIPLIILGMGEDGHIASLFPGGPQEPPGTARVYAPVMGPKPPSLRVSLTHPAIAAAGEVWVLVSGAGKEHALGESLEPRGKTPLAQVIASRRKTAVLTEIRLPGWP